MLRKIQKYEKKILFGIMVFVALSFGISWQMLALFERDKMEKYSGEIMGKKITNEEFNLRRYYSSIWAQCWLQQFNNNPLVLTFIPPFDMVDIELYHKKREEYFNNAVWVWLIFEKMADKNGILISPNEIVDYIKNRLFIFSTKEEGFVKERYLMILTNWQVSEIVFERVVADYLKTIKYREMVMDTLVPDVKEVYEDFLTKNEEIKIAWIAFDSRNYAPNITIKNEDELIQYFDEHSKNYEVPEKIQVEYIMASNEKVKKELPPPTDEAILNYYTKNRERVFPDKTLPQVRGEIIDKLLSESANEQLLERITTAEERITLLELQGKEIDFKDIAQKFNLDYQMTGLFLTDNLNELEKELGKSSLFTRQVTTFQEKEISRTISTDKGHFIFRLLRKQGVYLPKLTDHLKEKVRYDYIKDKSSEGARTSAEKLVQSITDKVKEEISADLSAVPLGQAGEKDKQNWDENLRYKLNRKWFEKCSTPPEAGLP
ncbi:MAG: hypothetical protein QME51_07935, partial [Planctomycetota bacterium]|nr:hypothetical protein [Planctomycetota bacterium]MDI6788286.1 hypothetical protein [Planctomycetota bacterium]